ncbi:hypothetical protein VB735_10230 [Halotia wernerae UHCC 0503]|nr:hypothetical protein [Halotia wernerae UHCC 0503]
MKKLFFLINLSLKTTTVCYLLNIAFFIPPVTAQSVKTQILPNLALLNPEKVVEKNTTFNPNDQKQFFKLSSADTENTKRKTIVIHAAMSLLQREKTSKKEPNFSPLIRLSYSLIISHQMSSNLLENKSFKKENQKQIPVLLEVKTAQNSRVLEGKIPQTSEIIKKLSPQVIPQANKILRPLTAETLGIVKLTSKQKNNWWHEVKEDSLKLSSSTSKSEIDKIENRLERLPQQLFPVSLSYDGYKASPGFTISNPTGYGADNNTIFFGTDFQSRTRLGINSDGAIAFGIGVGDAVKLIGAELAYTLNTLGNSQDFGSGSFSIKVHRQIAEDISVAAGWNQFADILINPRVPFDYPKNSYYIVSTKLFKTQKFIDQPFSRVAVTVGVGSGQFINADLVEEAFLNNQRPTGLGVFASVGVRIFEPVSMIIEWTGQDLGAGLSIVPFKNLPFVITPAFRDIRGEGVGARFIMGTGVSFQL